MRTFIVLSFFLMAVVASCSRNIYRTTNYKPDSDTDFKRYKTFAWLPEKDSAGKGTVQAIMRNNTVNYFTHCFGEMGYKADVDEPDLLLQLVVKSETKEIENPQVPKPFSTTSVTIYSNPFLHPLSNPFHYNKPFTYTYVNLPTGKEPKPDTYLKNAITLNVIDRVKQKLVWRSTASANLYDSAYQSLNLHPVVYEMLNNYPVKPIKKHKTLTKKER